MKVLSGRTRCNYVSPLAYLGYLYGTARKFDLLADTGVQSVKGLRNAVPLPPQSHARFLQLREDSIYR
jgi:hypothetical protein